jgi:asparagine synthase (glutamine-hydrolysing)
MLTSLEVRAPFLDHRIVTFAFGRVPDAYRTTPVARKILLRHLARRLLPPALDLKRKQGFVLPLSTWFRGEWGRLIEDVLHEADPTIFDRRVIHRLLARQRQGFSNAQRLFLLVMFELWRREYRIATPAG